MLTKAKITFIKSLKDKRARDESGLFVAEGVKLVSELIGSDIAVREVYALPEVMDSLPFYDNIYEISGKDLERISNLRSPQGVVAVAEIPRGGYSAGEIGESLSIALDDIQDPGNLGTIIRIADWFGIRDIFCSHATADCFNPKVVQATMGAISRVKVHYTDLQEFLSSLPANVPVYGTFLDGGNIYRTDLTPGGIIVMGNEGRGISPAVEEFVSRRLFIPPFPDGEVSSESLNVAVATAIVCSEFRRNLSE